MPDSLAGPADLLRQHIAYDIWATEQLLAASETLAPGGLTRDFGTADKSVGGTLTHLYRSERTWLARLEGIAPNFSNKTPGDEELSFLMRHWPDLHANWQRWAASLEDDDVSKIVDYKDLKGNSRAEPLWPIIMHVVNHSTHHRGQISGFIRALGQTPPSLDLITFVRFNMAENE